MTSILKEAPYTPSGPRAEEKNYNIEYKVVQKNIPASGILLLTCRQWQNDEMVDLWLQQWVNQLFG